MANEISTMWKADVIRTSESKELARVGTPQGTAYELIGVNGMSAGGLQPIAGFERIYELDFHSDDLHDETSVVTDFFPVNFRIGADKYGYGFVYRARRSRYYTGTSTSAGTSDSFTSGDDIGTESTSSGGYSEAADVFIDFWDSTGSADLGSSSPTTFGTKGYRLLQGVSAEAQMDVVVFGRLIYVFISGRDPALFYVDAVGAVQAVAAVTTSSSGSTSSGTAGNAASYTKTRLGNTASGPFPGPGRQPTLTSPQNATPLGAMPVPPTGTLYRRPGVGQVVLTQSGPQSLGLYGEPTDVNSSESGHGSSSFIETTSNAGSDRLTSTSSSLSSSAVGAPYSDPTSVCSATSGTDSLSANAPKIIAGIGVIQPLSTNALYPGNTGLLNRPVTQALSIRCFRVPQNPPYDNDYGNPYKTAIPVSVDLYFCSLTEYLQNPAVMDTPVFSATTTADPKGKIATNNSFYEVTFHPSNIRTINPGTVYLWGVKAYNASTQCGFAVGNVDEPIAGDSAIPAGISEADFRAKIGGYFKYRTSEGVDGNSVSSDDPLASSGKFSAQKMEPGDYAFGYQLYDSKTGRKSAFSEVAQARQEDFSVGLTSELSDDVATHYIAMELGYDATKFDQAYIYRSVKLQDAGGTSIASIRLLDNIIKLKDYQTTRNLPGGTWDPAVTAYRHAVYFYRLEDKQLIQQDVYYDPSSFDEAMPKGGTACLYGGSMFVSKITDIRAQSTADKITADDGIRGIGELRYSALASISPELFPPGNRYVPALPSSEVVRMKTVGANAIGFSKDRLYHIRREGASVKPQDMHEGYGIANHKAVDVVGSLAYFVTSKGVKAVSSLGELDDFKALDYLIQTQWVNQLDNVSLAFDPAVGACFIHNPDLEHTAVIWFNSGMITELVDMVFSEVRQGAWPSDVTDYTSSLADRAMFLQNAPQNTILDVPVGFKPRIYILDNDSSRTIVGSGYSSYNGQRRKTLLDFNGDTRFVTTAVPNLIQGFVAVNDSVAVIPTDCEGAYLYVLDSSDASFIGVKVRVHTSTHSHFTITTSDMAAIVGLPVDSRVGLSPVYFRWVGSNVGVQDETGQSMGQDFHRVKQINALGCSFVDVSGPPVGDEISSSNSGFGDGTTDAKFQGLVYRGTDSTPASKAFPKDGSGAIAVSVHETEGERWAAFGEQTSAAQGAYGVMGVSLSPGVEVFCPDLDFRLLSVLVSGKILDTLRTRRFS